MKQQNNGLSKGTDYISRSVQRNTAVKMTDDRRRHIHRNFHKTCLTFSRQIHKYLKKTRSWDVLTDCRYHTSMYIKRISETSTANDSQLRNILSVRPILCFQIIQTLLLVQFCSSLARNWQFEPHIAKTSPNKAKTKVSLIVILL
jgi:hypothetical protein